MSQRFWEVGVAGSRFEVAGCSRVVLPVNKVFTNPLRLCGSSKTQKRNAGRRRLARPMRGSARFLGHLLLLGLWSWRLIQEVLNDEVSFHVSILPVVCLEPVCQESRSGPSLKKGRLSKLCFLGKIRGHDSWENQTWCGMFWRNGQ